MTTDDLAKLPPPEKKVAAKKLYQLGWSTRKIEQWLGISDDTVRRAADIPTPDDLRQFEAEFELAIKDMKRQGVALVCKRIIDIVPKERKLDQLVKAGEFLEGRKEPNTQVQINNIISNKQSEYAI